MIVVDTSVLSLAFRRNKQVQNDSQHDKSMAFLQQAIEEDWPLLLPGIVYQEMLTGLRASSAFEKIVEALSGFDLYLANQNTHLIAAKIRTAALKKGVSCSGVDCLIAATTIEVSGRLLSMDRDFSRLEKITRLELIDFS